MDAVNRRISMKMMVGLLLYTNMNIVTELSPD